MKCGPDGCPIVAYSDLTPAEQRVERARKAHTLTARGFTLEQIAKQFGVSKSTISTDLVNFPETGKLNQAKTASNPKGAGRPKGTRGKSVPGSKVAQVGEAIRPLIQAGESISQKEWAERLGVGTNTVQRAVLQERARLEALPDITPEALSMSAQKKLETAIRQHKRRLDFEFENRVQQVVDERLDHIVLPVWRKKIVEARKIYDVRRSITNRETYNFILKCLHPDKRRGIDDAMLNDAVIKFMALEKYLLNEKDSPTTFNGLPTTTAEWDKRRQEAANIRRAKRGHSNVGRATA